MRRRDGPRNLSRRSPMYFRHFTREHSADAVSSRWSMARSIGPPLFIYPRHADQREVINYRLTRVSGRERAARALAISRPRGCVLASESPKGVALAADVVFLAAQSTVKLPANTSVRRRGRTKRSDATKLGASVERIRLDGVSSV